MVVRDGYVPEPPPGTEWRWGGWHLVPYDPSVGAALRRARALALQGRNEEAVGALNLGIDHAGTATALLEARGALYASLGFRRAAQRDFELALRADPTRGAAWHALARVRLELALPRSAMGAVQRAQELGYKRPELDLVAARALRKIGRWPEAAARFAKALRATPDAPPAVYHEAVVLCLWALDPDGEGWSQARERRGVGAALSNPAALDELRRRLRSGESTEDFLCAELAAGRLCEDELVAWTRLALHAVALQERQASERLAVRTERAAGSR